VSVESWVAATMAEHQASAESKCLRPASNT
jgi:hypothetical protein